MIGLARLISAGLACGAALVSALALAQDSNTLLDGRPGTAILATPGPDSIEPIYAFPPNCLPIVGVPNSGINRLLANVSGEDLRIAVMAETSGRYAWLGKGWRDGIQLAADIANGKGGIMGRRIVIETKDVGPESQGVDAVAAEVVKSAPFAVFGPVNEQTAQAAISVLRRSQMPLVLGTAGIDLQSAPLAWVTRGQPSQYSRLLQLADHAREEFKARNAAVIWAETDYGRNRREILLGALHYRNLEITVDSGVAPEQDNFADILARVQANDPDVLFLMTHNQESARLLAGLRRQGFNKPILVDGDVADFALLAGAGQNANGLRGIVGLSSQAPVARVRMMSDRFTQQFGYRPPASGVNGFIAFNMLKASIERACSFNGPDLFKTWRNLKIDTRTDPGILMDMKIDWGGNVIRDEFVFEIRNGRPAIIGLQHPLTAYN